MLDPEFAAAIPLRAQTVGFSSADSLAACAISSSVFSARYVVSLHCSTSQPMKSR